MTLPDIPEDEWRQYEVDQFNQQAQQRIDGLGFEHAANAQIATLEPLPAPSAVDLSAQAPAPADLLARTGGWAAPAAPPPPPPEPAPQPEVQPTPPAAAAPAPPPPEAAPQPEALPSQPPGAAPLPAPNAPVTAPLQAPPAPAPAPAQDQGQRDVFGDALTAAANAGADVGAFANDFAGRMAQGAGDTFGHALTAVSNAGGDVSNFASNFAPPPPPPAQPAVSPSPSLSATPQAGTASVSGVPDWLAQLISQNAPPQLANDPDFIRTVAAGAKAESGWDVNSVQKGGGGRGLFQFDLGGMGAGIPENQLLGQSGAQLQASQIVPLYARAYASAPQGLSGAEKASWVAAQAERPLGYDTPTSAARRNYASAYTDIGADQPLWQQAGNALGGAVQSGINTVRGVANQVSQFGDKQLSSDEAYAACGPAAAVRFASMFGRNPTLREATDLAASVGWSSATGMAGIGSEKSLMDKLGIPTRLVGPDLGAIAREAATGNPVTISTPGHYFFADGYDPQSGAFHVGQSGLDLRGGSEWMTPDQITARMGQIQGALFADNPQSPAPSTADQGTNPLGFLDRAKDALGSTWGNVTGAAQQAQKWWSDDQDVNLLDQAAKKAYSLSADVDTSGVSSALQTAADLAGQAPSPLTGGTLAEAQNLPGVQGAESFLGGAGRELGSQAQKVLEERLGSPGAAASTLSRAFLTGGASLADVGMGLNPGDIATAGLEAAGVPGHEQAGFEIQTPLGPIQIGPREVLGQLAGLGIPMGTEEQGARLAGEAAGEAGRLAGRAGGEVLGRGLGAADLIRAPEVAYAASRRAGESMDDYLSRLAQLELPGTPAASDALRAAQGVDNPIHTGQSQRLGRLVNTLGEDIGPNDTITVYHATTPETAASLVENGFVPGAKAARNTTTISDPSVARMLGKNVGDALDYEPGRGQGQGVYFGTDPRALRDVYGNSIVAIDLPRSALEVPPERATAAMTPERALLLQDGYTTQAISPDQVRLVNTGGVRLPRDLAGTDFGDLASQVRSITPEEARRVVGGAWDPSGRVVRDAAEEAGGLVDAQGRLLSKPTEIEQLVTGRERPGLSQLVGPSGQLLSTVAGGEVPKFRVGAGLPIESIIRSVEGTRDMPAPSADTLQRMPNLMHLANGDPELQASIQRSAEANPQLFDRYQRGVVTHQQLIEELAPALGMTPEQFLKNPVTRAYNEQELLALRAATIDKVGDLTDAASKIANAGGVKSLSPEDKVDFVLRMNDAQRLIATARGAASTAGRALNQQRINVTRGLARSITSGNEAKAAQVAEQAATRRAAKAEQIGGAIDDLKAERSAAVAEAQRVVRERTQGAPRDEAARAQSQLKGQLQQISDLYDELGRYKAMSLAEKDDVFQQEAARRAQAAADRADILANREPNAVQDLLNSLKDELGAEKKHFAKSRETWQDMGFWASKRGEILKQRGIEGQGLWLKAQQEAARKEASLANSRAARAFMESSRAQELQTQQASKILERLGGKSGSKGIDVTDEVLQKVVDAMQKGDPIETAQLLRGLTKSNWWDRVQILRYAGMLSSTATHTAQALANAGNLGIQLASHPLAVGADATRAALTGADRTRYMAELGPMVRGSFEGLSGGLDDARQILRSGINPAEISRNIEGFRPGFDSGNKAVDVAAELPLRVLEASDAFFRGGARGAYTRGMSVRQAINEGYRGAAMNSRADEIMHNLVDHPDLVDAAEQMARRAVFQERRGDVGAFAASGKDPGSILRSIVLPFVRTPWNVAAQGVGLTPAGFIGAGYKAAQARAQSRVGQEARAELADLLGAGRGSDLANADLGTLAGRARAQGANRDISNLLAKAQLAEALEGQYGGQAADQAGRALLGTMTMGGALKLALDGNLTAGYPDDPNERSTLPEGWQPWAVRMPTPGGGHAYVKYNNLGAVGVPLGISASMVDQGRRGHFTDPGKAAAGLVSGPLSYLTDTTMLQQLATIMDAQKDPAHKGENFLEQTASSFLPYGALGRQLQRAGGTPTRDPQTILEALEATYPGLSGMVQPKMNALGDYVTPTQTGLGAFVSPATYGMAGDNATLRALNEARAGVPAAPQSFRNMQMTPQEQRQFQRRAGQYLQQYVPQLVADPVYQSGTDLEKQAAMRTLMTKVRTQAGQDVLGQLSDDELARRQQLYLQAQQQRLYPPSEAS